MIKSFDDALSEHKSNLTKDLVAFNEGKRVRKLMLDIDSNTAEYEYYFQKGQESKQAEIDALEESRMAWREYAMKIESGEYELVKKAEAEQAKADTKRIDFLADKSQSVANVMLPTEIVERNLSSLRDAIDEAMMIKEVK